MTLIHSVIKERKHLKIYFKGQYNACSTIYYKSYTSVTGVEGDAT
jgi:hypothetical protein